MSFFKKITFILGTVLLISQISNAAEVYIWKSADGTPVLSEKKPADKNIQYKTVNVNKPTVIKSATQEQDTPQSEPNVTINQNNVQQLENSEAMQEQNKRMTEEFESFPVSIIYPKDGQGLFSKEQGVTVKTKPQLAENDKPVFRINGAAVPAIYKDGDWNIPRPTPGEVHLSIEGKTADGKDIQSTNSPGFHVHNGWQAQTNNNARAAAR